MLTTRHHSTGSSRLVPTCVDSTLVASGSEDHAYRNGANPGMIQDICVTRSISVCRLRVHFFKKIQDWILKSEIIRKRILRFFTQQINPRSFGSRCLKGAEESTPSVDSSVPLIHHDPRDLGLICLVKKHKIRFRILSDVRIQSWIFLKKRTLRMRFKHRN